MKAVLISIRPYWVFLIIAKMMGWNAPQEKTVEIRKNYPKAEDWNKVAKIYCSKDKRSFSEIPKEYQPLMERFLGKVMGEFVCDRISEVYQCNSGWVKEYACISQNKFFDYLGIPRGTHFGYEKKAYGWHISDLVIYDEPKELCELYTIDKQAVMQCEHRERACNNPDLTNGAFLPGSYVCMKSEIDWCSACKRKPIIKPPQSWCYVEGI